MTKQKLFIVLLFVTIAQNIFGQKVSNIDFDDIKIKTQDSTAKTYYPVLLKRFQEFDTTLTKEEYKLIYYGSVYRETYSPYGSTKNEDKFLELYQKRKYYEAISTGEETVKENPVNIKVLHYLSKCHDYSGNEELAKNYGQLYNALLDVISSSGNGKSIKTAYVVIKVSDEYQLMGSLGLTPTQQALVGVTDVMTISQKGQKPKKRKKKIKKLYFNVSKPFESLSNEFKKKG